MFDIYCDVQEVLAEEGIKPSIFNEIDGFFREEDMIGKNKEIVTVIQQFIADKKREKNIVNEIIRDDVFAVLKSECVVLYFALNDDRIESVV